MSSSARQTACWNAVPAGAIGGSDGGVEAASRPAK
jgi:hypothetical protein